MSKHIDLLAVAVLILAIAIFGSAKRVIVTAMQEHVQYFRLHDGREVRIPSLPQMPRVPRIPLQRD